MYQNDYDIYVLLDSNFFATNFCILCKTYFQMIYHWKNLEISNQKCIVWNIINHDAKIQSMYLTFFSWQKHPEGSSVIRIFRNSTTHYKTLQNMLYYNFVVVHTPKTYSAMIWWDVCYVLSHSRNHAIFKWCDFSPFHLFFISGILWIFNWVTQK